MSAFVLEAPASEAELEVLAERLRERNFEVLTVQDGEEARAEVMKRLPAGSVVHSGKSKTLEDIGVFDELMESETHDFVRKRTAKVDRVPQRDEVRKGWR